MKRIVIIGASSGLGLKISMIFAETGWKVAMAARRTEPLQTVNNQYPDSVVFSKIDITTEDSDSLLTELIHKNGGADVILLAAGIGWQNAELDMDKDLQTVNTNSAAMVRIVNTAYHYFVNECNGNGQIAIITSIAGTMGLGISATYSATKRMQSTYLEAIEQLAHINGYNITVTDIRPGFVKTALLDPNKKYPMLMNVDCAAKKIVNAIIKKKSVAYIDWKWHIVVLLWKLIPRFIWTKLKIKIDS